MSATTAKPRCAGCRFWVLWDSNAKRAGTGECRRRAPLPVTSLASSQDAIADWPLVYADDWCGEHEPAEPTRLETP